MSSLPFPSLSEEVQSQSTALRAKSEENEKLKIELSQLRAQVAQYLVYAEEIEKIREILQSKSKELDQLRITNTQLDGTIQDLRDQLGQLYEYQSKLAMLSSEIERLQKMLENKAQQIDILNQKLQRLETQLDQLKSVEQDKQAFESKAAMLQAENQRLQELLAQTEHQLELAMAQLHDYEQQIQALMQYEQENQRMKLELQNKDAEIEEWRKRYEALSLIEVNYNNLDTKYQDLLQENANLKNELAKWQALLNSRGQELQDLKAQCSNQEVALQQYQLIEAENSRLKDLID